MESSSLPLNKFRSQRKQMRTTGWITHSWLAPLTPALVIAAVALLYAAPAAATGTIDQSQTVSVSTATVGSSTQQAQIFTVGRFGWLNGVSLLLENYSASPPAGSVLTVSIQTLIGGLPSGKVIRSATIALGAIPPPGFRTWVDVNLQTVLVNAGAQYAIVLHTNSDFGSVNWWYASTGYANYTGGAMAFHDGIAWRINSNYDFAFKTYVIPDVLDQSQTRYSNDYAVKIGPYAPLGAWSLAQIFTAGLGGVLDRVRVRVERCNFDEPVDVTIQTVSEGYPSGEVIGQGAIPTVAGSCYLGVLVWVDVGISGAAVTAGTQYALVIRPRSKWDSFKWGYEYGEYQPYSGGEMVVNDGSGWRPATDLNQRLYAAFQTYIAIPVLYALPPPPPGPVTPCSLGVCPVVIGSITPMDSTARVRANVRFQEFPNGKIQGILDFDDSQTGDLALRGCNTESAACRLTVRTLACTDQHAITVAGTYTPSGEFTHGYELTLSGVAGGAGTFTFTAGGYSYSFMHLGIVDVTCPPAAGGGAGQP